MNKKIGLLIILSIMFIGVKVDAASYNMSLNTVTQEVEKDSVVDIYINLNNISGISDGLNTCEFNLDYDSSKTTINSISGENGWNVTEGEKIIVDTASSVTTNANIVKINAKVLDNNIITIKNINCTDGTNEYAANNNTLSLNIKQVEENTDNETNSNDNNTNIDEGTVESPKTGVKEFTIMFMISIISLLIVKKMISKRDLFKRL